MRTATTLGLTDKGWVLVAGPDVPADKQRRNAPDAATWPKNVTELQFQVGDGVAKRFYRDKAISLAKQIADAERRADAKAALAAKRDADAKAEAERKRKAEADEAAKRNAKLIADKEAAKKLFSLPKVPVVAK